MLVVMALGGNALLRRGEPLDVEVQRRNLSRAVTRAIAPVARRHQVVITHGNGPQIGLLALQAAAYKDVKPYPLDVLGAESAGMIGYLIGQSLANELPGREIATLLTQVEVDPSDPAFDRPTKPIGPVYDEAEAQMLAARTNCILVARRSRLPACSAFAESTPYSRDQGDQTSGSCRNLGHLRWGWGNSDREECRWRNPWRGGRDRQGSLRRHSSPRRSAPTRCCY